MVIVIFYMEDKVKKYQYFEGTFLLDDISMNIVLNISFLILNNAKIYITD